MSFRVWLWIAFPLMGFIVWQVVKEDPAPTARWSPSHEESGVEEQASQEPKSSSSNKNSKNQDSNKAVLPRSVSAPGSDEALSERLKKWNPKGKWNFTRSPDKRVTTVSGSVLPGAGESVNSAMSLAQDIIEGLGIASNELIEGSEHLKSADGEIEAYHFDQSVEGYVVDNGYIRTFIRPTDKAVYFVTNEIRDIGDVDTRISYRAQEAQAIALGLFKGKTGVVVDVFHDKPMIYNVRPGYSELVWKMEVKIAGPLYDRRLVMISTSSGRVVLDQSLLKY